MNKKSDTNEVETVETVEELKKELEAVRAELDQRKAEDEGWLILVPNAAYNGITADIRFVNGMAFIRDNQVIPRFVPKEIPANQLKTYSEFERAEIAESFKIPSSKRAVDNLIKDFGYSAEHFTKDQKSELDLRIAQRAAEAKVALEALKESEKMTRLTSIHQF